MVVKFQDVMNKHLRNYLEKLTQELEEKVCSLFHFSWWLSSARNVGLIFDSSFNVLVQRNSRKDHRKPFQDLENDILNLKLTIGNKKAQLDECLLVADKSRDGYLKAQEEEKRVKKELEKIRTEKNDLENEGESEF